MHALRIRFCTLLALLPSILIAGCRDQDSTTISAQQVAAEDLPDEDQLRERLDEVLDFCHDERLLRSDQHGAWQILHGVLAYGRNFEIEHNGELVNVVDWVTSGGNLDGWSMRRGPAGLIAEVEAGTKRGQGHPDQWLAILSQCDLPSSHPIQVGSETYTIADLVKQTMFDVWEGKECSWTLIGLTQYIPLDSEWTARDGQQWTIEKIMAMEARQNINASACGGTHRLIGMSMALNRYREKHPDAELTGGWKMADDVINEHVRLAEMYQQPSGAFSVNYFSRPANSRDLSTHMGSTGHTLEFLTFPLTEEQLREPWVIRSVVFLCDVFEKTRRLDIECGKLYHAAHGLVLYRERLFGKRESYGSGEPEQSEDVAPLAPKA